MGFSDIDATAIGEIYSIAAIDDLARIGQWVAGQIKLEHFGSFITK